MKKIREVMRMFEPCDTCDVRNSVYCKICTEDVKKFLLENGFDNDYRTFTVHEICHRHLGKNRYRCLYVADDEMFMVDYTVIECKDGKPCVIEDVDDIELPEKEEILLPFKDWDTKGLSPEEYLLNEIKKYRTVNMGRSDCVYHMSVGHVGDDLDLAFVVLFDEKKNKYCGVSFAHQPVWVNNELTIEYIVG